MLASKQSSIASLFFALLLILPKVQAQRNVPSILSHIESLDPKELEQVVQGMIRPQVVGTPGGAQANFLDGRENFQASGEQYEPAGFGRGGTLWTRAQAAHEFLQKSDTEGSFKGKDIPTRPSNNVDTQTQLEQALKVIGLINGLIATIPGVPTANDMTFTGDGPEGAGAGQDNSLRVKMTPGGSWRASS